jgi:hypothetical protein
VIIWPRTVLPPRSAQADPLPVTTSGPASLSGVRQVVAAPAAVWVITLQSIPVASVAQRLTFRALGAQIQGRANPVLVPVFDRVELRGSGSGVTYTAPHSDDSSHSDGSLYASGGSQAVVAAAASMGDVALSVTIVLGSLEAGQHLSIGNRLYRVARVDAVSGSTLDLIVWPPLRDDVVAGSEIELDNPVCKCRLYDDAGMNVTLEYGRTAFPTVKFLEDIT